MSRDDRLPLPNSIESIHEDLPQGLLPLAVFHDQQVFDLELERIFTRTWVFIGHEDEVPNQGDFVSRFIGRDPFILVRGSDGELRVLFNSCRHRGAKLCRVERGHAKEFVCPFHGWSFTNTGDLSAVPAQKEGYKALNFDDWALLGEPHRWVIDANWKQGAENFCGDSSHTPTTHRSALNAGMVRKEFLTRPGGKFRVHVHDCDGHAISIRQVEETATAFWDYPEDVTKHFRVGRLNQDQFNIARRAINHNGTIFPNFSFLHFSFTDSADRPEAGFLSIRVWQPKGPGKTEIWNWILAPREASQEYKERAYRVGMASFGPSGSFEQDDVALWPGVSQSAATTFAKISKVKLNYQMGLGDMSAGYEPVEWPGPGHAVPTSAGEGGLRTFHKSWLKWMTTK